MLISRLVGGKLSTKRFFYHLPKAVTVRRAKRSSPLDLNDFLKAKKIAVVGVSNNEAKFGFRIFRDLIQSGCSVEGINPRAGQILGKKIYPSLKDLPFVPDLVITVVPPEVTDEIVDECQALGIREIWMQPGSESESAIEKAKSFGISVTHNACIMVRTGVW